MPKRTVNDVLRQAWALIEDEVNWTQGTLKGGSGQHCALGAVSAVTKGSPYNPRRGSLTFGAIEALSVALPKCASGNQATARVWKCNDNLGHRAVRRMFLKAIRNTDPANA